MTRNKTGDTRRSTTPLAAKYQFPPVMSRLEAVTSTANAYRRLPVSLYRTYARLDEEFSYELGAGCPVGSYVPFRRTAGDALSAAASRAFGADYLDEWGRRVFAHTSPVYIASVGDWDDDRPRRHPPYPDACRRCPANTSGTLRSGGPTSSRRIITARPITWPG